MEHLVIIGNGITGVTVARLVRKESDIKITLISDESRYFFSRTALMYIYMGHMRFENTKPYEDWFWEKNDFNLIYGTVTSIDTDNKRVIMKDGETADYSTLVVATGSKSNKFGWPGQDLPGVQGLYSLQDLELLERNTRGIERAVIVGGGLIGIELAEMLHSRHIHVTFLVREHYYWDNILPKEDARLVSRHILEHGFDLRLQAELKEIIAGPDGRVRAVVTNKEDEIATDLVGLTPGVHPNLDALKGSSIETDRGVLVNDFLETNIPDVYAAGDCVEIKTPGDQRNRIEQLWYTGKMQAEALAKTLLGTRTKYDRGTWFNSAKFLDLEYQTYGFVPNVRRVGYGCFYWEHPYHKHAIHIIYSKKDGGITGINTFGIRLRHEVFDKWINEKKTLEYVVTHLREANFDPEFYRRYEAQIVEAYNREKSGKLR